MDLRTTALGVSRRRRTIAYLSLYTAYSLLKPAIARVAIAVCAAAILVAVIALR